VGMSSSLLVSNVPAILDATSSPAEAEIRTQATETHLEAAHHAGALLWHPLLQRLLSPATEAIPSGSVCSPLTLYTAALLWDMLPQLLLPPVTAAVRGSCDEARGAGMGIRSLPPRPSEHIFKTPTEHVRQMKRESGCHN
jgi:hypothetical protein